MSIKEALAGMSVDVIQQLANGIKILLDSSLELEEKVNYRFFFSDLVTIFIGN